MSWIVWLEKNDLSKKVNAFDVDQPRFACKLKIDLSVVKATWHKWIQYLWILLVLFVSL